MCAVGLGLLAQGAVNSVLAVDSVIPPGVPEPGMIIWGQVYDENTNAITIESVAWWLNIDQPHKEAIFSTKGENSSLIKIATEKDSKYYVLRLPADYRKVQGNANLSLSDPSGGKSVSFESGNFNSEVTMVATINGQAASVYKVNGVNPQKKENSSNNNSNNLQANKNYNVMTAYTVRVDLILSDPDKIKILSGKRENFRYDVPGERFSIIKKEDRPSDVVYYQNWK